jgi:hypothetical protein
MEGLWINPCSIDNMITSEPGSLQPTLRWEAFLRAEDLKADKAGRLATVRDPTYEVRIWRADGDFPAEQVYERSGLGEPVHAIETPLAPGTLYLWTIRARFALDGAPRVTEWGVLLGPRRPDRRTTELPRRGYYRFETPKQ